MPQNGILIFLLIFIVLSLLAQDVPITRIVSERLLAAVNYTAWFPDPSKVSPSNDRLIQVGYKQYIILDGKPYGKLYDSISTPIFSPDGKRMAYAAESNNRQFVVMDGVEGKRCEAIKEDAIVFSPNSQREAYPAKIGSKWVMIVDGKEGYRYDALGVPVFSPDSNRVAYAAESAGKQFVIIDGKEESYFDKVGTPIFSPDSNRIAYAANLMINGLWLLTENHKRLMME